MPASLDKRSYFMSCTITKSLFALVPWHPMHPVGLPNGLACPVGVNFAQNQSQSSGLYPLTLYMTVMAFNSLAFYPWQIRQNRW